MDDKCPKCGAPMENQRCTYCGYTVPAPAVNPAPTPAPAYQNVNNTYIQYNAPAESPKSKIAALLFCIFLGYFGAHYFYVGKIGWGIINLLTCGMFGFGWIIDIFRIAFNAFKDKNGLPLRK